VISVSVSRFPAGASETAAVPDAGRPRISSGVYQAYPVMLYEKRQKIEKKSPFLLHFLLIWIIL